MQRQVSLDGTTLPRLVSNRGRDGIELADQGAEALEAFDVARGQLVDNVAREVVAGEGWYEAAFGVGAGDEIIGVGAAVLVRLAEGSGYVGREKRAASRPDGEHHGESGPVRPFGSEIERRIGQRRWIEVQRGVADDQGGIAFGQHLVERWPVRADDRGASETLGQQDSHQSCRRP